MKNLILLFCLSSYMVQSQVYQQKNIDFSTISMGSPMEIPLILAGNFGEMRGNHFHTGLDIKTLGVEGQKIIAVADGYVSRLRVSPWGYGNAVYIDHGNGLTSLYAHLSRFSSDIDSMVYAQQALAESYELDAPVLVDSFFVKKGELIAYSGNSGSSYAPHLHFEIRETQTEHALNPLLFNCYKNRIKDTTPPGVYGIKLYAITDKGYMIPGKSAYYPCSQVGKKWVISENKPIDVSDLVTQNSVLGIGVNTTDKLDDANNSCGIYHSVLTVNGKKKHEQRIDYLKFDDNRFLNSHQDYYEFTQNKKDIHKNFTTVINPLAIYPLNDGKIDWTESGGTYEFTIFDAHGNSQEVAFTISAVTAKPAPNPLDKRKTYFFPDSVNTLLKPNFEVLLEAGCFYEPLQIVYRIDSVSKYLSPIYQFSESIIPVQSKFDVRIKAPTMRTGFPLHKLGIGHISDNGNLSFVGGDYVDGWVEAHPRSFGKFVLVVDSLAPTIKPLDFAENKLITKFKTLELEINDNLAGVVEYKAYLNGKWVLMEYDRRGRKYIIPLDKHSKPLLQSGKNSLRIWAKDAKGNIAESAYKLIY